MNLMIMDMKAPNEGEKIKATIVCGKYGPRIILDRGEYIDYSGNRISNTDVHKMVEVDSDLKLCEFVHLKEQNTFLKEQHAKDIRKLNELTDTYYKAVRQMNAASDMVMAQIIQKYGEKIYDDDGTLIGYRVEVPAPKPEGYKVMCEPYVHYIGLVPHTMYRIGIIQDL